MVLTKNIVTILQILCFQLLYKNNELGKGQQKRTAMETSSITSGEETDEDVEATGKTEKETSKVCEPEIPNSVDVKVRGENESTSSDLGAEDTLMVSGGSIQASMSSGHSVQQEKESRRAVMVGTSNKDLCKRCTIS
jgi:hypothetical protein